MGTSSSDKSDLEWDCSLIVAAPAASLIRGEITPEKEKTNGRGFFDRIGGHSRTMIDQVHRTAKSIYLPVNKRQACQIIIQVRVSVFIGLFACLRAS